VTIPVVFINPTGDTHRGAWWDQTIVEHMIHQSRHNLATYEGSLHDVPNSDGIVLVVHAESDHADTPETETRIQVLNERLARYRWVLLIVTSDETDRWPWWTIKSTGRMIVWRQHPTTSVADRALPLGPPPHAIDMPPPPSEPRNQDWFFAGQVTHRRRTECVETLRTMTNGDLVETEAFLTGLPIDEYMRRTADAMFIPCPSGPWTADTFRLYEALESGCVPIVDTGPYRDIDATEWRAPFPVVSDWGEYPTLDVALGDDWRQTQVVCESWWQRTKRNLVAQFDGDITDLSGVDLGGFTVIVSTSPIPSHPDTRILAETVESVLTRCDADVIVAADGVRPEQADMTDRYLAYLREVVRLSRTDWKGRVWVDYTGEWLHQAGTTRRALANVWTPAVLFVEHDTPLIGDIPFDDLSDCLGMFDVIRLHHEASIHPEHAHLNHGPLVTVGDLSFQPTVQWSQRPHLATVAAYWRIMERFSESSRTMIEDLIHSTAQTEGWEWMRTAIFHPVGGIKRSTHLDGREGASKYEMRF